MAYDNGLNTWPFGADAIGKTYGPKYTGNESGPVKTEGIDNEVIVNFDTEGGANATLLAGSLVSVVPDASFATGAVATATVGGVDILTGLPKTVSGELVITGPTAGDVVVRYTRL